MSQWHTVKLKERFVVNFISSLSIVLNSALLRYGSSKCQPYQTDMKNYLPSWEHQVQMVLVCFRLMKTASTRTCCQYTESSSHVMLVCGCLLKFICREWHHEKALRQMAL